MFLFNHLMCHACHHVWVVSLLFFYTKFNIFIISLAHHIISFEIDSHSCTHYYDYNVYYYSNVSHVLQTSWGTLMLFIVIFWLNTHMCNYLKIKFHIKWNNVMHHVLRLSFMLKELWEHSNIQMFVNADNEVLHNNSFILKEIL